MYRSLTLFLLKCEGHFQLEANDHKPTIGNGIEFIKALLWCLNKPEGLREKGINSELPPWMMRRFFVIILHRISSHQKFSHHHSSHMLSSHHKSSCHNVSLIRFLSNMINPVVVCFHSIFKSPLLSRQLGRWMDGHADLLLVSPLKQCLLGIRVVINPENAAPLPIFCDLASPQFLFGGFPQKPASLWP